MIIDKVMIKLALTRLVALGKRRKLVISKLLNEESLYKRQILIDELNGINENQVTFYSLYFKSGGLLRKVRS